MKKFENQKFEKQVFQIEESWFINCVLRECDLFYGGGHFEWANTAFENCHWHFQGAARDTIQVLLTIGLLKRGQAPPTEMKASSTIN